MSSLSSNRQEWASGELRELRSISSRSTLRSVGLIAAVSLWTIGIVILPTTGHAGVMPTFTSDYCIFGEPDNICSVGSSTSQSFSWEIRVVPGSGGGHVLPEPVGDSPQLVNGVDLPGVAGDLRDALVDSIQAAANAVNTANMSRSIVRAVEPTTPLPGSDEFIRCTSYGGTAFQITSEMFEVDLFVTPKPTLVMGECEAPGGDTLVAVGDGCPGAVSFNPSIFRISQNGNPVPEPGFAVALGAGCVLIVRSGRRNTNDVRGR